MSGADPIPKTPKPADDSMVPVFYSIVVYPGVGQWMQHRKTFSLFYGIVFFIFACIFAWIFYKYLSQVIPIIRNALEGALPGGSAELPPLSTILKPFTAVMIVYFANVADVIRGRSRLRKPSA